MSYKEAGWPRSWGASSLGGAGLGGGSGGREEPRLLCGLGFSVGGFAVGCSMAAHGPSDPEAPSDLDKRTSHKALFLEIWVILSRRLDSFQRWESALTGAAPARARQPHVVSVRGARGSTPVKAQKVCADTPGWWVGEKRGAGRHARATLITSHRLAPIMAAK